MVGGTSSTQRAFCLQKGVYIIWHDMTLIKFSLGCLGAPKRAPGSAERQEWCYRKHQGSFRGEDCTYGALWMMSRTGVIDTGNNPCQHPEDLQMLACWRWGSVSVWQAPKAQMVKWEKTTKSRKRHIRLWVFYVKEFDLPMRIQWEILVKRMK